MDGRLDGCGVQDEKDGVIGRRSGVAMKKNKWFYMGKFFNR